MEAAVGVVLGVARVVDLVRLDELVPGANLRGDRDGGRSRPGRGWAHRGHRDGASAEHLVGDREDERAVDAPRVADER